MAPPDSAVNPARDGSGEMFDRIAERYDLLNRLISLGIDQRWRRRTVDALELDGSGRSVRPQGGDRKRARALDLATGTGDLALLIADRHDKASVVGLDPSSRMLEVATSKVHKAGLDGRVELVQGTAEQLPFADGVFDAVTIAFGIRNVPDRPRALSEMARVTRRDGRVAVLELSEPRSGPLGPLARFHVHTLVPWVGGLLSGSNEYRYLQQSIAEFPPPEEFASLMERSGLEVLRLEPLTFGVCHLYVARPR